MNQAARMLVWDAGSGKVADGEASFQSCPPVQKLIPGGLARLGQDE